MPEAFLAVMALNDLCGGVGDERQTGRLETSDKKLRHDSKEAAREVTSDEPPAEAARNRRIDMVLYEKAADPEEAPPEALIEFKIRQRSMSESDYAKLSDRLRRDGCPIGVICAVLRGSCKDALVVAAIAKAEEARDRWYVREMRDLSHHVTNRDKRPGQYCVFARGFLGGVE